jgi:hypothetical protein
LPIVFECGRFEMLPAIEFDCKLPLKTVEVDDESRDRDLPAEFEAAELSIANA